ncbi:hypothetical protein DM860_004259 [Cuscuta australis]|uniref:phosphatidate phosphatase n=1 Tax=Cuscuta australis TaxID=267555 RepID=A0A328EAV0_9ASTE|nr:hypothetical protein DM860_004259 [Cuscuta australis]
MNVVGKVGSIITAGVYSVATPFHPFGGAVDIIAVKQQDGSFRSTPWYVRFGKFQGVLKGAEKEVRIEVNGVEADFHMYLDNSGEAYFVRESDDTGMDNKNEAAESSKDSNSVHDGESNLPDGVDSESDHNLPNKALLEIQEARVALGSDQLDRTESGRRFYEFDDVDSSLEGSIDLSGYESSLYENLEAVEQVLESQNSNSEVVLVSVDGHILTAPISSSERTGESLELGTPQFHLGPGEETNFCEGSSEINSENVKWGGADRGHIYQVQDNMECGSPSPSKKDDIFGSCLALPELALQVENESVQPNIVSDEVSLTTTIEINGTENGPFELPVNENGCDLCVSLLLSDLQVEVKIMEENTLHHNDSDRPHVRFALNGGGSHKHIDEGTQEEVQQLGNELQLSDECTQHENVEQQTTVSADEDINTGPSTRLEISLCGNLLHPGMGSGLAAEVFDANRISEMEFKNSAKSIIKNENLVLRIHGKYLSWEKAVPFVLGVSAYDMELPIECTDVIAVEQEEALKPEVVDGSGIERSPSGRRWRLWPIPFRRVKTLEHTSSNVSTEDVFVDTESSLQNQAAEPSPCKQFVRTNVPTSDQIASLNLKEGQNMVVFIFSTRVLGVQKVEAHIYLWKWNARIVISDVDGTITKSDVLGQFMPLVGKDWTHSGIARLFSAIKENGYQLLFLSARAIVQAYLTKSFLHNLKQDGKTLPTGPVVISPDGLFPSLYREVIRRAPHEFKIACLEDIKALFPPDYNPFYAGFGNRDTDELSYRKIGIPKGKIFIINPKGEVAISHHRIDVKSYTSLHTLVNDMFPPTSMVEQEDYNAWNYWKMPLPEICSL